MPKTRNDSHVMLKPLPGLNRLHNKRDGLWRHLFDALLHLNMRRQKWFIIIHHHYDDNSTVIIPILIIESSLNHHCIILHRQEAESMGN